MTRPIWDPKPEIVADAERARKAAEEKYGVWKPKKVKAVPASPEAVYQDTNIAYVEQLSGEILVVDKGTGEILETGRQPWGEDRRQKAYDAAMLIAKEAEKPASQRVKRSAWDTEPVVIPHTHGVQGIAGVLEPPRRPKLTVERAQLVDALACSGHHKHAGRIEDCAAIVRTVRCLDCGVSFPQAYMCGLSICPACKAKRVTRVVDSYNITLKGFDSFHLLILKVNPVETDQKKYRKEICEKLSKMRKGIFGDRVCGFHSIDFSGVSRQGWNVRIILLVAGVSKQEVQEFISRWRLEFGNASSCEFNKLRRAKDAFIAGVSPIFSWSTPEELGEYVRIMERARLIQAFGMTKDAEQPKHKEKKMTTSYEEAVEKVANEVLAPKKLSVVGSTITDNYLADSATKTKSAGKCPYCGSKNTELEGYASVLDCVWYKGKLIFADQDWL